MLNARNPVCSAALFFLICTASQPAVAEQPGNRQWEREIQAFEAADRANPPPQGAILFIGSSTIRKWTTLAQDFPEHKALNQLIRDYIAKGRNLDYIDTFDATMGADGKPREELFAKDRLHFNARATRFWPPGVQKHLTKAPAEEREKRRVVAVTAKPERRPM